MLLKVLDILLFMAHVIVIVFNLTGWIWHSTRKAHLIVLGLTTMSWFVLGIWYGWGYCFLTDWHWSIKRQLGEIQLPNSFIQYFFELVGIQIQSSTTDRITLAAFILCIIATIAVHFRALKRN